MSAAAQEVTLADVAAELAALRQLVQAWTTPDSQIVAAFRLGWEVGVRHGRSSDPDGPAPRRPRHLSLVAPIGGKQ